MKYLNICETSNHSNLTDNTAETDLEEHAERKKSAIPHLINGTSSLLSYLAAACAKDLGEVLSSREKVSNRDFTFGAESRAQWLVHFSQVFSMCLPLHIQKEKRTFSFVLTHISRGATKLSNSCYDRTE